MHVAGTLRMNGDTAAVLTSQGWERMMSRPDGSGADRLLAAQKHRETWRRIPNRWFACDTVELGGDIFINGDPYTPCPERRREGRARSAAIRAQDGTTENPATLKEKT
jgi:hypothetical protein